ncbi:unannotated protein [freshwater metagenome]|uniref:Unannotated protein n=1 Tax=freshwater metagenome TaxID=449393 RepID=A0A6J7H892_9ZZZZ
MTEPAATLPTAAPPEAPAPAVACARSFLTTTSGPIGKIACRERLFALRCVWNAAQRSHSLRCRRTGGETRCSDSETWPSSSRTSSQVRLRASEASASATRARTRSDLTLGTVVSIASAIWSYERASISRSRSAVRCVSGSALTSPRSSRNSSRRWAVSAAEMPWSATRSSRVSTPMGWIFRRWFRHRLRAMRYSHGRTLIARSSPMIALNAFAKTSCRTSSASSREPSMCRQKASRRDWYRCTSVSYAAWLPRRVSVTRRSSPCRRRSVEGPRRAGAVSRAETSMVVPDAGGPSSPRWNTAGRPELRTPVPGPAHSDDDPYRHGRPRR